MNLRVKSLISLASIGVLLILVLSVVMYQNLITSYLGLEDKYFKIDLTAVASTFTQQEEYLYQKIGDWSNWDDTYKYIQDKNKAYEQSNLVLNSVTNIGVDAMAFFNTNGEVVEKIGYDFSRGVQTDFPVELSALLSPSKIVLATVSAGVSSSGNMYIVAERPILKSDGTGPAMGKMIFVRFFNQDDLAALSKVSGHPVAVLTTSGANYMTVARDSTQIIGKVPISDIAGKPIKDLVLTEPRDIYNLGRGSVTRVIGLASLFVMVSIGFNFFNLYGLVLNKINEIESKLRKIINDKDQTSNLEGKWGNDELGHLATLINGLLQERRDSYRRVEDEKKKLEEYLNEMKILVFVFNRQNQLVFLNKFAKEKLSCDSESCPIEIINQVASIAIEGDKTIKTVKNEILIVDFLVVNLADGRMLMGNDVTKLRNFERENTERFRQMEVLTNSMVERELRMAELKKENEKLMKGVSK